MSFGFYTGLKGLNAARMGMQLAGHNIANLNTRGFTRQQQIQQSSNPITMIGGFQIGTGAEVSTIRRVLDSRLEDRIRTQNGLFGRSLIENRHLTEIEGALAEPSEHGLSNLMNEYFGAIGKLRADAGNTSLRGGLLQNASSMTDAFNNLAGRYQEIGEGTLPEVKAELKNATALMENIATLNAQIVSLEANGTPANDLRDNREQSIKDLSEIMDTQVVEKNNGSLDIMTAGYMVVSGGRASPLKAVRGSNGQTEIRIGTSTTKVDVKQGRIAALLKSESSVLPGILGKLDKIARTMILETNRIHSTGMPKTGPFTSLVSDVAAKDGDQDGKFDDEILAYANLPFEVKSGALYVAMTDATTGEIQRTKIDIDPMEMTMGDFADALSSIDHLSAVVDPTGRLRINSDAGHGFDFSNKLDANPNSLATFGSGSATLGGSSSGPFDLNSSMSFSMVVDGGTPVTINLASSDFKTPTSVPASEVVSVLNSKLQAAGVNAEAVTIGKNISFKATSTGSTSSLQVSDLSGSAMGTLGIPTGTTSTGRSSGLEIEVQGNYTGKGNGSLRFVAEGDGVIGVTKGLKVSVFREDGTKIATLDVGEGHDPLDALEVGDGIKVFIKHGEVSKTNGDQFALDTLEDTDTSDILVGLGLNNFFTGSGAADIGVSQRLEDNPDLISAGLRFASSDNENLVRMANLRERSIDELSGGTIESFYNDMASDIGFESKKSMDILESEDRLLGFLENERQSISGVNLDEEMVDLTRHQEAFQASARFISTLTEMTNTLMNLAR
jgi:flagellar hook-associated protein 1